MNGSATPSHAVLPPAQRTSDLLLGVETAVRAGDLQVALRLADAAMRFAPGQARITTIKAAVLARLGQHQAALALLPDPPAAALLATRLKLLGDAGAFDAALHTARQLLGTRAVDGVDGLANVLDDWLRLGRIPGWRGFDSALRPVGSGSPEASPSSDAPGTIGPTRIEQLDFGAEGWVWRHNQMLEGEVRLSWAPRLPLTLQMHDLQGQEIATQAIAPALDGEGFSPFRWAVPAALHRKSCRVGLLLPDGRLAPLIGSPAVEVHRSPAPATQPETGAEPPRDHKIDVIVPVYGDRLATRACLDSLLASVDPREAEILVIDDASPDPVLVADLDGYARRAPHLTLLHNRRNLGFAGTVNVGLAMRPWRDAVLLNADCIVHGDWLARLRRAAQSAPDIGSVTPLGQGSITSYPQALPGGPHPAPDAAALDALARDRLAGQTVELPVAVGFCVYLKRAMLDAVGVFDRARFLRGYGEENDLCLRARAAGWRHVAAADVFVDHRGGASFGATRLLWMRRNQRVLTQRHPDHDALVERFLRADPLHPVRRSLDLARIEARLARLAGPQVLFVSLGLGGGVLRHIEDELERVDQAGGLGLQLRPDPDFAPTPEQIAAGQRWRLYLSAPPERQHDLYFDWPAERQPLLDALATCGFERIELHHIHGLPQELLEDLFGQRPDLHVTLHDHAWFCPRLTLSDRDGHYCGEPDLAGCERCIERHGSELGAGLGVAALRTRSARWLARARSVTAPTQDTRARYLRHFPGLPIQVQPWEAAVQVPAPAPSRQHRSAPRQASDVRVAVIGAISRQKGYDVLLTCAREVARQGLPIRFVVIGYTQADGPLLDTGRVFITGPYAEAELDDLVQRERCDLVWIPSRTPETWCYVLTHALRQGLPVLGYALGAVQERLQGQPRSRCLPLDTPIPKLLECFIAMTTDQEAVRGNGATRPARKRSPVKASAPLAQAAAKADSPAPAQAPASAAVKPARKRAAALAPSEAAPAKAAPSAAPVPEAIAAPAAKPARKAAPKRRSAPSPDETTQGVKDAVPSTVPSSVPSPEPVAAAVATPVSAQPDQASGGWVHPASVQTVALPAGIYAFSVPGGRSGAALDAAEMLSRHQLQLPAMLVGPAPTAQASQVELFPAPGTLDRWLSRPGDRVTVRVHGGDITMLLTSVRRQDDRPLAIDVVRLDQPQPAAANQSPLRTMLHIQMIGDLFFGEGQAGPVQSGMAVEALVVDCKLPELGNIVEYRGLTADGFETPWLSDGMLCGSRGRGVPLLGFALRARVQAAKRYAFQCEGYFRKAGWVAGDPASGWCRSPIQDDPLEGLQLKLIDLA